MNKPILNVYLDTNALQALKFSTELAALLCASQNQKINLYIAEPVVWERAKHYYTSEYERREAMITTRGIFPRIFVWFQKFFEHYGVQIIKTTPDHIEMVKNFIADKDLYFIKDAAANKLDALILSIAVATIPIFTGKS